MIFPCGSTSRLCRWKNSPAFRPGPYSFIKVDPTDPTTNGTDPGITVKYGRENLFADAYTDLSQFIPNPADPKVSSLAVDCHAIDPFFDTTGYLGAFQPGQPTWLSTPWVSLELQ